MPPDGFAAARSTMVDRQLRRRGILDPRVLEAMRTVPREVFVPEAVRGLAYADQALPIGHGQTISQPFVVATMLALAQPQEGERALDVGTGSGYAAALLVALGLEVVSIERIAPLAEAARAALADAVGGGVDLRIGDGRLGAPDRSPFDVVMVAAAAPEVPPALVEQLADGGRLVMPVGDEGGQRLLLLTRDGERVRDRRSLACRFVPLVAGP
ncbi:MAG: protein-L-isoaspartate(D-aspartate) O-methyltransferase [Gaiella sp.]